MATAPSRFWIMNRMANPVVSRLLRSPAHRLLSRAVLLLTIRGRRTGRLYTLPVQYVLDGDTIVIVPGLPHRKTWWRNLRGGAPVRLHIGAEAYRGTCVALSGAAQLDEVEDALTCYIRRFPQAACTHEIHLDADLVPDPASLRKAAVRAVVVKITLAPGATAAHS